MQKHLRLTLRLWAVFLLCFLSNSAFSQIDVKPVDLQYPYSSVICLNNYGQIRAMVKNNSLEHLYFDDSTTLQISVTISGPKSGFFKTVLTHGDIYQGSTNTYDVGNPTGFNFDIAGNYTFKIKTSIKGDVDTTNDETTVFRTFGKGYNLPFFENMSSAGINDWRLGDDPCLSM